MARGVAVGQAEGLRRARGVVRRWRSTWPSASPRARRRLAALLRLGPPAPVPPVSVDALALADALQGLTLAHRQVVVLYYLADLPVEQVAAELRVPVGTVKARLARAREALAARLADPAQKGT